MADHGPEARARPPFSRIITPDAGAALQGRIEANAAEREALARFYRIDDLASLTLEYRLDPLPPGCCRLTGVLQAALTQRCVVTVEPVAEVIREDVSLEFWPEHLLARADFHNEPEDVLERDPPEPIINGRIDLGHLAAEIFASAINPYPRKDGVEFDWTDPKAEAAEAALKPFAALARLKGKG
jgi:Large ribosomal RNA subunit accumulation protein YceD